MHTDTVLALTFDTGGTLLDWHSGFATALAAAGRRHGLDHDWKALANELRRRSLKAMLGLGEHEAPTYTFDDAHRFTLEALAEEHGLNAFDAEDIHAIAYEAPHRFACWPDFPDVLPRLRKRYTVASFTTLTYRMVIDTARTNGLQWDAIFSCEGLGRYKPLPETYLQVARYLQLEPQQCCMVACHNFDLDAARAVGFRTAYVRRLDEWGGETPPDSEPNPNCEFIVDDFRELASALGIPGS